MPSWSCLAWSPWLNERENCVKTTWSNWYHVHLLSFASNWGCGRFAAVEKLLCSLLCRCVSVQVIAFACKLNSGLLARVQRLIQTTALCWIGDTRRKAGLGRSTVHRYTRHSVELGTRPGAKRRLKGNWPSYGRSVWCSHKQETLE